MATQDYTADGDEITPAPRTLTRETDRRASGDGSAQHRLDGGAGPDPGGHGAGAISHVADRRDARDRGKIVFRRATLAPQAG